jgi:hypothetical protein
LITGFIIHKLLRPLRLELGRLGLEEVEGGGLVVVVIES